MPLISLVSCHCLLSVCDVKLNQEYSRSTPFLTLPGNILQDQTLRKSHRLRKRKNGERKKCNVFLSGARMNFTNQIYLIGVSELSLEQTDIAALRVA